MDPFKDCEPIYDPHFIERMVQRSLPGIQIAMALRDGKKIQLQKDVYKIKWNKWSLIIHIGSCILVFETAYRHD